MSYYYFDVTYAVNMLRIPMRGYESPKMLLIAATYKLRIPMRGYECPTQATNLGLIIVTNPHAGL